MFDVDYVDYVTRNNGSSLLRINVSVFSTIVQSSVINFKRHHKLLHTVRLRTLRETDSCTLFWVYVVVIAIGTALNLTGEYKESSAFSTMQRRTTRLVFA